MRDVSLSPTGLLVSIKTPPLSSETGDAVRLNTKQETDYAALGNDTLERNIFSDCINGLDGETGDIALPPLVSLGQNVFPSVSTSVPEEETGNAVLPETQEQITHSVVLTNDLGGETNNAVLPVVIDISGGGRETDNAVLTTTHAETGNAVSSLGPTEGPNHLDGKTGNTVPIPSDEATTVAEFFSNNSQRVPETKRNENSKGRGKSKGRTWVQDRCPKVSRE